MKVWQKEYDKIQEHRRTCSKWGKDFCLECFGGGLIIWMRHIEPLIIKNSKQEVSNDYERRIEYFMKELFRRRNLASPYEEGAIDEIRDIFKEAFKEEIELVKKRLNAENDEIRKEIEKLKKLKGDDK